MTQEGTPKPDPTAQPAVPEPEPLAPLGNQAQSAAGAYTPPPVPPPVAPQPAAAWAPAPAPAAPQPAVAWAPAPAAAVAVTGQRTVLAAIAGVLLLLGGILGGILGLLVAVVGGSFVASLGDLGVEIPELNGADAGAVLGGMVAFLGIIVVVYSLVYLFAGIGVLRNRGWGRVMGLIVGIISGLIWLSGLTNAGEIASVSGGESSLVPTLIMFAIHAYIVVVLLLFWRSKPSTA